MKRLYALWIDLLWLIAFALAAIVLALRASADTCSGGDYVVAKFEIPSRQIYVLHADKKTWHYDCYPACYMVCVRDPDADPEMWDEDGEIVIIKFVMLDEFDVIEPGQYHYFAD